VRRLAEIVGTFRARLAQDGRLRVLAVALLVLIFSYPILANMFLAFGGVQRAFAGNKVVKVDFRSAWSMWPGRVHVSRLRITIQDRDVQFELQIPSADVTVGLRDLRYRTFHATRVRGSGVVFHLRHRVSRESANEPFVRELPSIAGFADPPLFEDIPPAPPRSEGDVDRLWTVHIEDVDVGVSDLWVQMFRYQGSGRALGAFRLRPTRSLWVGPAELRLERGHIDRGARQIAAVAGGGLTCKVEDFDVRAVHGSDVFHFVSADGNLKTERIQLGALAPCPWLEANASTWQGHLAGHPSAPVDADLGGALDRVALNWGTFRATASRASLKSTLAGERLSTEIAASGLGLRNAGGPPRSWKADVRSGKIRTDVRLTEAGARGSGRLEATAIAAEVGDSHMQGDLLASLDLSLQEPSYRVADATGSAELRQVTVRAGNQEVRDWWTKLELRKTHFDTRQDFDFKGSVRAEFKDAMPALYVLSTAEKVPKWTTNVLPTQGLQLDLGVERSCRWTDVKLAEPEGGPLLVSGRVQTQPGASLGALLFRVSAFRPLSLGLAFDEGQSDTSPLVGQGWLDRHLAPLEKAAVEKRRARCRPEPTSCGRTTLAD
jgi:hypothetical protein